MIPFVACCYAVYYALERQLKRERMPNSVSRADSAFAGGLLAFQGADAQVDKALKWRYVVATKPFILAVWRLSSPSKAK